MIQLDEHFRITIDPSKQNFMLEKLEEIKDKKNGGTKKEWLNLGYFGSNFSSILKRYKNEAILNEEQDIHINEILDRLVEMDNHIDKYVKSAQIKLVSKNND
jgi:hypothetical protein